MASFEVLSGDFERQAARIRYSEAGRSYVRLESVDGVAEDVFLATQVMGAAEAGEGRMAELLARWAERDSFAAERDVHAGASRGDRVFVVLLRDGRKFAARGSIETLAEIKDAAALREGSRTRRLDAYDEAREANRPPVGGASRFMPNLLARFLPNR